MLYYMYCDKIENLKENAVELFKAADQYQMDNLKGIKVIGESSEVHNGHIPLLIMNMMQMPLFK